MHLLSSTGSFVDACGMRELDEMRHSPCLYPWFIAEQGVLNLSWQTKTSWTEIIKPQVHHTADLKSTLSGGPQPVFYLDQSCKRLHGQTCRDSQTSDSSNSIIVNDQTAGLSSSRPQDFCYRCVSPCFFLWLIAEPDHILKPVVTDQSSVYGMNSMTRNY